jgi:hypothetical protein
MALVGDVLLKRRAGRSQLHQPFACAWRASLAIQFKRQHLLSRCVHRCANGRSYRHGTALAIADALQVSLSEDERINLLREALAADALDQRVSPDDRRAFRNGAGRRNSKREWLWSQASARTHEIGGAARLGTIRGARAARALRLCAALPTRFRVLDFAKEQSAGASLCLMHATTAISISLAT